MKPVNINPIWGISVRYLLQQGGEIKQTYYLHIIFDDVINSLDKKSNESK